MKEKTYEGKREEERNPIKEKPKNQKSKTMKTQWRIEGIRERERGTKRGEGRPREQEEFSLKVNVKAGEGTEEQN